MFKRIVKKWLEKKIDQFDLQVSGQEHLQGLKDKSFIITSNHLKHHDGGLFKTGISSDTFIIGKIVFSIIHQKVAVVANYKIGIPIINNFIEPITKIIIKKLDSIPAGSGKEDFHNLFLKEVEKVVLQKRPILIYPAGRQDFDFENHHEIKAGAGYISLKFNLPIVPAYIKGAHHWHKKDQEVQLSFGKPFEPKEMTIDEISEKIKKEILLLKRSLNGG
jgi:1-acyl-sn-glycerol-3-phosphate acyltransferase